MVENDQKDEKITSGAEHQCNLVDFDKKMIQKGEVRKRK